MSPTQIALQRGTPLTKNQMLNYQISDAEIALAWDLENGTVLVPHLSFSLIDSSGFRIGSYQLSLQAPLQLQAANFECKWANGRMTVREAGALSGIQTAATTGTRGKTRGRKAKAKAVGSTRVTEVI